MTDKRIRSFVSELQDLLRKHNAEITGCGCCGSPSGKIGPLNFEKLSVKGLKYRIKVGNIEYSGSTMSPT